MLVGGNAIDYLFVDRDAYMHIYAAICCLRLESVTRNRRSIFHPKESIHGLWGADKHFIITQVALCRQWWSTSI